MDSAVNPQPDGPHIRINHQIHREIIRRRFTQRQRDIIDFILTLSWGCGKSSAIIPMLKHFELCGIRKAHIRKELEILVDKQVLFWDERINVFQINKHFDLWTIEHVQQFNSKQMNEIIKLNIETPTPNLNKRVTKKVTELPKKIFVQVTKKDSRLLKRILDSYQKRNYPVTKKVTVTRDFFNPGAAYRTSKTIIKAIIKNRTTRTTTKEVSYETIFNAYEKNFISPNARITEFDVDEINTLFSDYGGTWLLEAMREAYKLGEGKRNLGYVHGILKGYKQRGGPTGKDAPAEHKQYSSKPPRQLRYEKEMEELRMFKEEEDIES